MAKYRKVDPRIWNDEKYQSLAPLDKLIGIYCLTSQVNRIGIFKFSVALAAEDLGLKASDVRERLDRVCHTLSWPYDEQRRVLYLPNWWKYNNPGSGKTFVGCLEDLHEVPQTPLLNDFATNTKHLSDSLCHILSSFLGKGMPYQEQEQEQEQEQDEAYASCSELAKTPTSEPVLVFETSGKPKTWNLGQNQIDRWVELYPGVDVMAECRKALGWVEANPTRRKTANGMMRFLNGWLTKGQNSRNSKPQKKTLDERLDAIFEKDRQK